jgi:hypothetical protein
VRRKFELVRSASRSACECGGAAYPAYFGLNPNEREWLEKAENWQEKTGRVTPCIFIVSPQMGWLSFWIAETPRDISQATRDARPADQPFRAPLKAEARVRPECCADLTSNILFRRGK